MELDLRSQIREFEQKQHLTPEQTQLLEKAYREIAENALSAHIPGEGEEAPAFTLPNAVGIPVSLADAVRNGPAVVTFYRGIW